MMLQFSAPLPLSLYIHLPWCVRKCPYCDFNSHAAKGPLPESEYIDALLRDLEQELPSIWGRTADTIFIGGGTPSLFAPASIDSLLSAVRARVPCRPDMEITLEANPGTVEQGRFTEFRAAGVNRLSIGIQSFDPQQLQALGRIHGRDEALRAAEAAHAAGFDNFNLDLMFGLPGQNVSAALADLATAIALAPTHVSWYQLTLEPNTPFYRDPPSLPDDDVVAEMQIQGQARLADAGYAQYEVSAYARTKQQCRHNLNYWRFGDYLGIGAGAHGKCTDAAAGTITRRWKQRHPQAYQTHAGTDAVLGGQHQLTPADALFEFMLNALRLTDGFQPDDFVARTGLPLAQAEAGIAAAQTRGLLEITPGNIRPSEMGRRFLNDLTALFLEDSSHDGRRTG